MIVRDVFWTPSVNHLVIDCDCGQRWIVPSNASVLRCSLCHRVEMWHGVQPRASSGLFSAPLMTIDLAKA